MKRKVTIYRTGRNWRWRMQARNGAIVGASTEGYLKRGRALENLFTVTRLTTAASGNTSFWV